MKKKLSIILCMILLASAFTSCSEAIQDEPTANDHGATQNQAVSENASSDVEEAPEETAESFDPGLPARDFDGDTFTFVTKSQTAFTDWAEPSIWSDGYNGEVLNDAIYSRNLYISDTYNANIEVYSPNTDSIVSDVQNAVTAGDTTYDVVMPALNHVGSLVRNGYLFDLKTDAVNMDLSKPWWDQRSIEDLSIANKLYMVSGDISTLNNDATWCTMINLQVLKDHGFDSPYTYVANDTWNFDTYKTLCEGASIDLDGDGDFDSNDSIANLTQNENATAMFITFGNHLIDKDENDLPTFTLEGNERAYDIMTKVSEFMNDKTVSLNYHNYAAEGYHLLTTKMFEENRGLFWITNLQMVIRLREMETDFGIAPCPKYDESQEEYRNVVWFVGSYATIPTSAPSAADSSFILEAMAAKSRELLRPAYYEVALSMKYLRDRESIEMLDLVIDNRSYELEHAFSFGASAAVESIVLNGKDPASTLKSQSKVINKQMENLINMLTEKDNP